MKNYKNLKNTINMKLNNKYINYKSMIQTFLNFNIKYNLIRKNIIKSQQFY